MKIATAAYALDWLDSWAHYEDKIATWVAEAAGQGADLLVFPEYGAMELSTLAGAEIAGDLERSIRAVSDRMEEAAILHQKLATEYGVHILGASAPVIDGQVRPVNHDPVRARRLGHRSGRPLDPVRHGIGKNRCLDLL